MAGAGERGRGEREGEGVGFEITLVVILLLALQSLSINYGVFQAIFNYWKDKDYFSDEKLVKHLKHVWLRRLMHMFHFFGVNLAQKMAEAYLTAFAVKVLLLCLKQPPPPVNDTNPYNVFRPREKAHRLHTRRMQRRENNVQSFEKLRQVRRNLDQAKTILEALIKREEKKRDVMDGEVSLQRMQLQYRHETELLEDTLGLPGFPPATTSYKFGSSDEEFMDSDDYTSTHDPNEPVMLFTKPLVPEKLAAAGIVPPAPDATSGGQQPQRRFQGRMGRGGRIIFDRWNPLMQSHINCGNSLYIAPNHRSTNFN
ncbi:hypothetical protein DY000_02064283 [Brassica cretica]|uniref:BZIP domain-containing protein n=1 Tax=Brassica cretica TaxID=69181 RepID=A0ABQ7AW84_BRACR|nr:hypothetical protein DY000_02064283 [Brassica cretica]